MPHKKPKLPTQRRLQNKLDELADDVRSLRTSETSDSEDPFSTQCKSKANKSYKTADVEDSEGSLFGIIKAGKNCLQAVVDDWIESYMQDRNSAVLELSQFFIQCSGCKARVTQDMLDNMEPSEIVSKMTVDFGADNNLYPLIQLGPQWKKFKTSFCEFVQTLGRQCQNSIIYDQYMMDKIISLLICLTDTPVRAFRHTSTLAAMKLVTALVDIACSMNKKWKNLKRQAASESVKGPKHCSEDRIENLTRNLLEVEENLTELNNMITYIFKGVFVHRYKDTVAAIRCLCLSEIGIWMKKCPDMFLDDSYLKYIGWSLYDKEGDVRLCCLKTLLPMYETAELFSQMEFFTKIFKDRIVEMTLDKEVTVAVEAVHIVTCILKYCSGGETVLSDKDCEQIYELVYSSRYQVAVAAGHFLNQKLFQQDESAVTMKTASGKKRSPNTVFFKDLIQFFIESELNDKAQYLVDSMWGIHKMMKDWECMTDLLLEDPGPEEEGLDDSQESALIEIMFHCVRQAGTGQSPAGRAPLKKLSTKQLNQVTEDQENITTHFIATLPKLLSKYIMDSPKVVHLLQISEFFILELYVQARQRIYLEKLLKNIKAMVEKHSSDEVLEACSKCLQRLCDEAFSLASTSQVVLHSLIDQYAYRFSVVVNEVLGEELAPSEEEVFGLISALRRIRAFYLCHDLSSWNFWNDLFMITRSASQREDIPEELVIKSIQSCSMAIIFYYKHLDGPSPDLEEMKSLRLKLGFFMQSLQEYLFSHSDTIKEEAYLIMCDLAIIFSPNIAEDCPVLSPIVFNMDARLTSHLTEFLLMKVFVEDSEELMDENMKNKEVSKRRNFLASFSKLIVYKVIHIKAAAVIFKHYSKFSKEYGDLIKYTLTKARENNKMATSKTLAIALEQMFHELRAEQGEIQTTSPAFQAIKELAKKFALSFGPDQIRNRQAVVAINIVGIQFSLTPLENPDKGPDAAPPNIVFLEFLCEFSHKLIKQDKKTVLEFLDMSVAKSKSKMKSEDWEPFFVYRNSLIQREVEPTSGRRKRMEESSSPESSSATSFDFRTPSPMNVQPLTSTAIRQAYKDVDVSSITEY